MPELLREPRRIRAFRRVRNGHAALGHHHTGVSMAQAIAYVPAHAQDNDLSGWSSNVLSATESSRRPVLHRNRMPLVHCPECAFAARMDDLDVLRIAGPRGLGDAFGEPYRQCGGTFHCWPQESITETQPRRELPDSDLLGRDVMCFERIRQRKAQSLRHHLASCNSSGRLASYIEEQAEVGEHPVDLLAQQRFGRE